MTCFTILQRRQCGAGASAGARWLLRKFRCDTSSPSSYRCFAGNRWLSSNDASPSPTTVATTQHLYMWGTDSGGSLLKPPQRRDETVLDVPMLIENWPSLLLNGSSDDAHSETAHLRIESIVCGPTDTAIVTTNGRCFVFGANKHGQLGLGHANAVTAPTEWTLPTADDTNTDANIISDSVADVSLGATFGAFVSRTTGDLYTAGFGGSTLMGGLGQLGHGDASSQWRATRVQSLVRDGCTVDQAVTGEAHLTVLTTEGEVLTTGAGSYGRLGNFETVDQLYLEPVEILTPASNIISIAGGKSFTLALSKDGVVYGWGRNHKGQLGTGLGLAVDMYAMQVVPEPIETSELSTRHIVSISAGHSHAAAISDQGELFYWGMALHLEPVKVEELLHTRMVAVSCGHDYTLALDEHGNLYSLGLGKTGVLGQGSLRRLNQPAVLEALDTQNSNGRRVVQFSAGWKHAACIVEESF
jgi:alpha-tubulin suppressor-like RCC1 family protein